MELQQRGDGSNDEISSQQDTDTGTSISSSKRSMCITDDLICPITLELPFDPVVAEDGRVYERSAITKHFQSHRGNDEVKSPVTNEPIGQRLLPCLWIRSHIETLVETGIIVGDLRDAWKKKEEQMKHMEEVLEKASGGDTSAMYSAFNGYFYGKKGFPKDDALAYQWVQKAHKAGSVKATALLGRILTIGKVGSHVITKNVTQGTVLMALAAERGSDHGAYYLGNAFADGLYGLEVDDTQAIHWLEKCLSDDCEYQHMTDDCREQVQAKLQAVLNRREEEEEN